MLQPKKMKFPKMHRGRLKGRSKNRNLLFGNFGLKALEACWLTGREMEAGRRVLSRIIKRERAGRIWIRPFPDKSVTYRPSETRMGSGKGAPEKWVAVIKPGQILYEIKADAQLAKKALKNASYKMPIKTKIIYDSTSKFHSSC